MTNITESPELGDLADGIQELTLSHPLNQKIVPIFCASKISGYVQVYIKRVDSKELAIKMSISMLKAEKHRHALRNAEPDLRCRMRYARYKGYDATWKMFDPSLWNDIVDHMEFYLVNVETEFTETS